MPPKAEVLQGTPDLLVLKTLDTLGPTASGSPNAFSRFPRICSASTEALSIRLSCASNSAAGFPPSGASPKTTATPSFLRSRVAAAASRRSCRLESNGRRHQSRADGHLMTCPICALTDNPRCKKVRRAMGVALSFREVVS